MYFIGSPLNLYSLVENIRVLVYSLEWKRFFVEKGFLPFLIMVVRTIFSYLVYTTLIWMCPSSWLKEFFLKILVCIKTLPCGLQRNDHGHEIVLNRIKDGMLSLWLILLEVDSRFIGGMILYHFGYITIKIMLFKNIQHPCLPCVEVGSTFKAIFRPNEDRCHGCNILLNSSRYM